MFELDGVEQTALAQALAGHRYAGPTSVPGFPNG